MDSITKNKQSNEMIEKMAKHCFGSGIVVKEIHECNEGFFNAVYNVKLSNELDAILKIAPPPNVRVMRNEANSMQKEVAAMQFIRENATIPLPQIYAYDTSKTIIDVEYFFMEKLSGNAYNSIEDISEVNKCQIETQAGEYIKQMNSITNDHFGYYGSTISDNWKSAFYMLLNDVYLDALEFDIVMPISLMELDKLIQRNADSFDQVKTPCLVHWDLWNGNIMVDGGKITGLLDFERTMWGDPLIEYNFGWHYDSKYFIQGYKPDFGTEKSQKARRLLYDLYHLLLTYVESCLERYEDNGVKDWVLSPFQVKMKEIYNFC